MYNTYMLCSFPKGRVIASGNLLNPTRIIRQSLLTSAMVLGLVDSSDPNYTGRTLYPRIVLGTM